MYEAIHPTRYPELGYTRVAPGVWRIVDTSTSRVVGPTYRTRLELLMDLQRYACGFGCADPMEG